MNRMQSGLGKVFLVGAGPGRAGLLTARAKAVLSQADLVVYDRLLSGRILGFASSSARFAYVGKEVDNHVMKQSEINTLLVEQAAQGRQVVRLKGGDPFVFGRGGEEAVACRASGITFEVIPGVTSAVAVPAFAGIPVTQRGVAGNFTVLTGHSCTTVQASEHEEAKLIPRMGTLVILMGVTRLETLVGRLCSSGFEVGTPVAVIRWGTRAAQQTLTGTLGSICRQVREAGFLAPAVIVVGQVVNLRADLQWFEAQPLMGQRILVASDTLREGREMADAIEALGAEVMECSVEQGAIVKNSKIMQLFAHTDCLEASLLFHGTQAVHGFFSAFQSLNLDWRLLARYRFGALNEEIARALRTQGLKADFVWREETVHRLTPEPWQSWESAADVSVYVGKSCRETVRFTQIEPRTEQFQAMWSACEAGFDVCWATSSEALHFAQSVQDLFAQTLRKPLVTVVHSEETRSLLEAKGVCTLLAQNGEELVEALRGTAQDPFWAGHSG